MISPFSNCRDMTLFFYRCLLHPQFRFDLIYVNFPARPEAGRFERHLTQPGPKYLGLKASHLKNNQRITLSFEKKMGVYEFFFVIK